MYTFIPHFIFNLVLLPLCVKLDHGIHLRVQVAYQAHTRDTDIVFRRIFDSHPISNSSR